MVPHPGAPQQGSQQASTHPQAGSGQPHSTSQHVSAQPQSRQAHEASHMPQPAMFERLTHIAQPICSMHAAANTIEKTFRKDMVPELRKVKLVAARRPHSNRNERMFVVIYRR